MSLHNSKRIRRMRWVETLTILNLLALTLLYFNIFYWKNALLSQDYSIAKVGNSQDYSIAKVGNKTARSMFGIISSGFYSPTILSAYLLENETSISIGLPNTTEPKKQISDHLILISAYYYTKSRSYPDDTLIFLFNANYFNGKNRTLICTSENATTKTVTNATISVAYPPPTPCRWPSYIARCNVTQNPAKVFIKQDESDENWNGIQLPFQFANQNKKPVDVGVCYSPLYFTEQWHLILAGLHIYQHFGVELQVFYIQSVGEDIWKFLQIYKEEGVLEFEPWPLSKLDEESIEEIGLDPRMDFEYRNQPAAYTDCLLKHKEDAQFLIMADLDDIWFPHMGNTFMDEFRLLSKQFPTAAAFSYERHHVECGRKSAVNTSRTQSFWIHWPGQVALGTTVQSVPDNLTRIYHFRDQKIIGKKDTALSLLVNKIANATFLFEHVNRSHLNAIESDFEQLIMRNESRRELYLHLKTSNHYSEPFRVYHEIEGQKSGVGYHFSSTGPNVRTRECPTPLKAVISIVPNFDCRIFSNVYQKHLLGQETAIFVKSKVESILRHDGCVF